MTDWTIWNISHVAEVRFRFEAENYPEIPQDVEQIKVFAQKHLLLHLSKNLGEIAGAIEPQDHGKIGSPISPQLVRKLLVNSLRLADVSGVSIYDIEKSLTDWSSGTER